MHDLIASPFLDDYVVLRPGSTRGIKIGPRRHRELERAADQECPQWLVDAVRRRWPDLDLSNRQVGQSVLVRSVSPYGFGRASYELNLGCNYDCEHCYLGLKTFEGLSWPDRERLLRVMRDAGVLWLQLTGGEPLIDKLFGDVYALAFEFGMMLSISSNGSRLHNPAILDLLASRRPYRVTLSVYGACRVLRRADPPPWCVRQVRARPDRGARGRAATEPEPDRHENQRTRGRRDACHGRAVRVAVPCVLEHVPDDLRGRREPARSVAGVPAQT